MPMDPKAGQERDKSRRANRGPLCAAGCGYYLDRVLHEQHGHLKHITCEPGVDQQG